MTLRTGLIVLLALASSYRAAAQKSTPEIILELKRFLHPAGTESYLLKCLSGEEGCQVVKLAGETTTAAGAPGRKQVSVWIDQFFRALPKGDVKASGERPKEESEASYAWYVTRGSQAATGTMTREQITTPTPEGNRRSKALAALEVRVVRSLKPIKK